MDIVTWNSRGAPNNQPAKRIVLDTLLLLYDYVLLQEAGGIAGVDRYTSAARVNYDVYGAPHAGAYNNRCGTAILTARQVNFKEKKSLVNSNGRFGVFVQDNQTDTIIATLHANAAANAAVDRTGFLRHLTKEFGQGTSFIIGADFNDVPPGQLLNVGSQMRPNNWDISASGRDTHFGNRDMELDYFVSKNIQQPQVWADQPAQQPPRGSGGSDHLWVACRF